MGIPAYFSHIVKTYPSIIKKFITSQTTIHNLYMDCNSIIYDAVRMSASINSLSKENYIIHEVILKIENYIDTIKPQSNVIIAFDGVCPIAKMEQQRSRRYKSNISSSIMKNIMEDEKRLKNTNTKEDKQSHTEVYTEDFNTTCITPGTVFMKKLNENIKSHFNKHNLSQKYKSINIITTTSDEPGEGEHKIFQYIRIYPEQHSNHSTVIYGLDADLIMLCINHLHICSDIFLFRETPEFIKTIDSSLEPNETYMLNMRELSISTQIPHNDYIFLCFFLGNDFLPHFPAVNIRIGGIHKLVNAYIATIKENECLIDSEKNIVWKNVRKIVEFLMEHEEDYIKKETKMRDSREKHTYSENNAKEKFAKFEALPQYERSMEKVINPFKAGWQNRYYKTLFNCDYTEENVEKISINYLEGLEWTMKYYSKDCPDWKWKYNYQYPPLLQDLLQFIPYFDTTFVKNQPPCPVDPLIQLCYVLPRECLHYLPERVYHVLLSNMDHLYPKTVDFVWCYCKYFWESHVKLPEIPIFRQDESTISSISLYTLLETNNILLHNLK